VAEPVKARSMVQPFKRTYQQKPFVA
jgi:hypothetical protein